MLFQSLRPTLWCLLALTSTPSKPEVVCKCHLNTGDGQHFLIHGTGIISFWYQQLQSSRRTSLRDFSVSSLKYILSILFASLELPFYYQHQNPKHRLPHPTTSNHHSRHQPEVLRYSYLPTINAFPQDDHQPRTSCSLAHSSHGCSSPSMSRCWCRLWRCKSRPIPPTSAPENIC